MTRLLGLLALAAVLWIFLEIGWTRLRRAVRGADEILVRCSGCGVYEVQRRLVAGACERCRPSPPAPLPAAHPDPRERGAR